MTNPNPSPFENFNAGLAPNLIPTPPQEMPAVPEVADATERLSPFKEAQNVDDVIAALSLDRPLPLYIPNREKYADYQFHIINDTPSEYAAAARRGWRAVDDPELLAMFEGKVSGTDKTGKITKPILMGRSKQIGEHEDRMKRQRLSDMNKGLDPRNRTFNGGKNVLDGKDASAADFKGMGIGRIKV